nr:uncharacterized protein LOC100185208 isoform X1 [Ciona intestinalis]XP_018667040.1 uncharacterized protein LOC100185208 isoform X2 [Ciona intestinalis]|eukprot:XP_002127659.2 uncharacterized protein LOC100185208 isoform X1 [Ciona intestinalis]
MSRLKLGLSVSSLVLVIVSTSILFAAFFTSKWLTNTPVNNATIYLNYGLWDNGLQNLNCDVTPFSICMYTRAGVFASMVLVVPAFLMSMISTAIVASGGNIGTSATLARSAAVISTIAAICLFIGVLLYTIQHTTCITLCPPTYNYYSEKTKDLHFNFSFYFAWVALPLLIVSLTFQFIFASLIARETKEGMSATEDIHMHPIEERYDISKKKSNGV